MHQIRFNNQDNSDITYRTAIRNYINLSNYNTYEYSPNADFTMMDLDPLSSDYILTLNTTKCYYGDIVRLTCASSNGTSYNLILATGFNPITYSISDSVSFDFLYNGVNFIKTGLPMTSQPSLLQELGLQGPQGLIGIVGSIGAQGNQGIKGTTGSIGFQGVQGVAGNVGIQGSQGLSGILGSIGFQGINGSQGNSGSNGTNGIQGNNGFQGINGSQGNQGNQGNIGSNGNQGNIGIGTQGNQGIQGVQGGAIYTPTIYNNIIRSLNSNYIISNTNVSFFCYSANISVTLNLGNLNGAGRITPQYMASGTTSWVSLPYVENAPTVSGLSLLSSQTVQINGWIPAGATVRLLTSTTGLVSFTYSYGQEYY